jgi:formylmethanofuran dehydrogenase subunit B
LPGDRLVEASTCLGCGCACDDITVLVRGERIVEARNACELGAAWFGDGSVPVRSRVQGRDVPIDEALEAAARLLARAARPLIYLAPDIACEVQREGIALADALRATLDSVTSATAMGSIVAAQERGRAGATLGEVRNRADLLVFWGVDPMLRYPRYWTRYAPEPAGLHVPGGRRSRTIVAIDVGDSRGPEDADIRIALAGEDEVAMLAELSAIVADPDRLSRESPVAGRSEESPLHESGDHSLDESGDDPLQSSVGHALQGVPHVADQPRDPDRDGSWRLARELAPTLLAARYVVFVADAELQPRSTGPAQEVTRPPEELDRGRADALLAVTLALNGPTRCALSLLRAGGNRSGADAVATWQTGYPAAVDFARGHPRYRPIDGSAAARLARSEVDAVLVIGSAAPIPIELLERMARLPCAIVGPRASESALAHAEVVIDTGVAGIHEGGMALRMDDMPLSLRPSVSGPPAAAAVAAALRDRAVRYRDTLRFKYPKKPPQRTQRTQRSSD